MFTSYTGFSETRILGIWYQQIAGFTQRDKNEIHVFIFNEEKEKGNESVGMGTKPVGEDQAA